MRVIPSARFRLIGSAFEFGMAAAKLISFLQLPSPHRIARRRFTELRHCLRPVRGPHSGAHRCVRARAPIAPASAASSKGVTNAWLSAPASPRHRRDRGRRDRQTGRHRLDHRRWHLLGVRRQREYIQRAIQRGGVVEMPGEAHLPTLRRSRVRRSSPGRSGPSPAITRRAGTTSTTRRNALSSRARFFSVRSARRCRSRSTLRARNAQDRYRSAHTAPGADRAATPRSRSATACATAPPPCYAPAHQPPRHHLARKLRALSSVVQQAASGLRGTAGPGR